MRKSELLPAFLESCLSRPFAWGSWDCCQFGAQWLQVLNGTDPRALFPAYSTEQEAREVLADAGGLIALVSSVAEPIHPSRAVPGDLVLGNDEGGAALGICLGVPSAHVGPKGLIYLETLRAVKAWRT